LPNIDLEKCLGSAEEAVKVFTDSPYNNRVANEEDVLGAGISL
jgi:hypothetical protein